MAQSTQSSQQALSDEPTGQESSLEEAITQHVCERYTGVAERVCSGVSSAGESCCGGAGVRLRLTQRSASGR